MWDSIYVTHLQKQKKNGDYKIWAEEEGGALFVGYRASVLQDESAL